MRELGLPMLLLDDAQRTKYNPGQQPGWEKKPTVYGSARGEKWQLFPFLSSQPLMVVGVAAARAGRSGSNGARTHRSSRSAGGSRSRSRVPTNQRRKRQALNRNRTRSRVPCRRLSLRSGKAESRKRSLESTPPFSRPQAKQEGRLHNPARETIVRSTDC